MKVIKRIDYVDGGVNCNKFELIEYKEYIVADVSKVTVTDTIETVEYTSRVWFALDDAPCEITQEDIEWLNTTEEDTSE